MCSIFRIMIKNFWKCVSSKYR